MFTKQRISLVAAALASLVMCGTAVAAQGDSLLTVNATLTSACAISPNSTISFGTFSTLDNADKTANSGSTFTVACSSGMEPLIFVTGTRTIDDGLGHAMPFNLSLISGATVNDLPATGATATGFPLVQDGTARAVPLYARLAVADFKLLPAGAYANGSAVTVSVLY